MDLGRVDDWDKRASFCVAIAAPRSTGTLGDAMQMHSPWFFGLLAHSGGVLVLLASAGLFGRNPTTWWRRVALSTAIGAVVNGVGGAMYLGPGPLVRDVVALVAIGALCAVAMGAAIWLLRRAWPSIGVWCAGLLLITFVGITPYLILIVHCTSGDCI